MGRAARRVEKIGRYAKLKRWLYGMRTAASGWEDDYARRLVEDGFQRGRAASTIFYHPKTQVQVVVHGDDFTYAGTESELNNVQARSEWYKVKVRGILGSGKRDVREIDILGRNLTWTEGGLEYEGSDKHRQALLGGLGFERGVEGGQQCSYETGGDQSRRRRRNVGRARNKKVQKCGSDVELHEFGQVGRAMRSEGSVHKNGESDSRQLEEVEGSRQVSGRSGESDVEDGIVEKR